MHNICINDLAEEFWCHKDGRKVHWSDVLMLIILLPPPKEAHRQNIIFKNNHDILSKDRSVLTVVNEIIAV